MEKCERSPCRGALLRVTVDVNGNRIHTLIDDTSYPIRVNPVLIKRDPMVEALFGSARATGRKKKR